MKLRERWSKISRKYGLIIFFIAVAALILGLIPINVVNMSTRDYQVVSSFYIEVPGWNKMPGDNDFYQITWIEDGGQLNARSFKPTDGSIHNSDSNFVRVYTVDMRTLFGIFSTSATYDAFLTTETLADLQGGA